jgi:syntaxin 5
MVDRTKEFLSIVRASESSAGVGSKKTHGAGAQKPPQLPPVSTLSEFHQAASSIAKNIHTISQQLSHLTRLVKRRGLFDDPTEEINVLVGGIKDGIQSLNAQLDAAQSFVDSKKRSNNTQSASHSVNVVGQLKSELMNTTKVFKDVLEERSSTLKSQADRKDKFFSSNNSIALGKPVVYKPMVLPPPPTSAYPPPQEGALSSGSQVRHRQGSILPRPSTVTVLPDQEEDVSDLVPLIGNGAMHAQQQLIPVETYYEDRATAMQDVQRHITELGTIFGRLATMLQDQREMVESIHDNIEDATENVNRGQLALMGTLQSLQGGRMLAAKVSGILLLFVLFFIIFML